MKGIEGVGRLGSCGRVVEVLECVGSLDLSGSFLGGVTCSFEGSPAESSRVTKNSHSDIYKITVFIGGSDSGDSETEHVRCLMCPTFY